ncbi:MAG: PdaC/SigV domain-containing protein [Novosphingobium sp.]
MTIMRFMPLVSAVLVLSACSESTTEKTAQPTAAATSTAAVPSDPPTEAPEAMPSAKPVAITDSTPLYEFNYTYPAQVASIPALAGWFRIDAAKQERGLIVQAKEGQAEAKADKRTYYPYGHSTKWAVVTDLPGWLSLSAERWESLGGAHPNPWQEGLVWDKRVGIRHRGTDFFLSHTALNSAIRAPFCAALDKQRAEKRGAPVDPKSKDEFDACIDPAAQTVILGSTDKQHFTRIGILVDPYNAGPYAEGNYEVTLPVTPAVLKAIKPQFRSAFAVPK